MPRSTEERTSRPCDRCGNMYTTNMLFNWGNDYPLCMDCSLIRHATYIYESGCNILSSLNGDVVRIPDLDEWREQYENGDLLIEEERNIINPYHSGVRHRKLTTDSETENESTLYYGLEIEIDKGGCYDWKAEEILAGYLPSIMHAETDGSLNDGFEIITAPCTIKYHLEQIDYKAICKRALALGYRAHDTSTAGLHIHASYQALGSSNLERDLVVAKLLLFICKNSDDFSLFCRRRYNHYAEGMPRYSDLPTDQLLDTLFDAVKGSGNRYYCLNLTNTYTHRRNLPDKTIELRLAKGTLKHTTLLATLEMYNAMIQYCMAHPVKAVDGANLVSVIRHAQGARLPRKNLKYYLDERFPEWRNNDFTPQTLQTGEC